jgi:hypothetical protein
MVVAMEVVLILPSVVPWVKLVVCIIPIELDMIHSMVVVVVVVVEDFVPSTKGKRGILRVYWDNDSMLYN